MTTEVGNPDDIADVHREWIARAKASHGETAREQAPFTKRDGTAWTDEEISRFEAWMASPGKSRARIGPNNELLGLEKPAAWPVSLVARLRKAMAPRNKAIKIDGSQFDRHSDHVRDR
ncbi:hypothetical protein O9X98_06005 [Agrobacterium salinitolerans]|nr:hypothetical protein [Agrobacterium salinitolerans]